MNIQLTPIGVIHSPYKQQQGTPIQPVFSKGAEGTVELFPEYRDGLADLDGFSHIILLYYFHKSKEYRLRCRPFLDTTERGLFATRAPRRPNPVGLSVVELVGIDGCSLTIRSLDILDGSPLLDIKPYIPAFDHREAVRTGWYERMQNRSQTVADDRFET